jgi:hypothetical protein
MTRLKQDGEPTVEKPEAKVRKVKTVGDAALEAADARQWRTRQSGLADQEEASEVRNLT